MRLSKIVPILAECIYTFMGHFKSDWLTLVRKEDLQF